MRTRENTIFQIFSHFILMCGALFCILPFILLAIASFTDDSTIVWRGYSFIPAKWSLDAYAYIWQDNARIFRAYGVTVLVTLLGTCINLVLTMLLAYPLSRKDLPGRKGFAFFVFFTMLFNGGLVPTYLLYAQYLGIKNTLFSLIMPTLMMSPYYVIISRTFFATSIPAAVIESAQIDGAGELTTFIRIILPMGRPIIATVVLFVGINYWNDWYNGMIYLTDSSLFSIQNLLNRMLSDIQFLQSGMGGVGDQVVQIPSSTIRMAIAVVGVLPIMVIYPFLQNNFVKGIAIGSVKG